MTDRPRVENAPGLTWRKLKTEWEARWLSRTDLRKRGFRPISVRIWKGTELDEMKAAEIADRCRDLQDEMLLWGQGGTTPIVAFDGTLRTLIAVYQTDPDSTYHKLRYRSRLNYDNLSARIDRERGHLALAEIKARVLMAWHKEWAEGGRVAMAHSLIGMLRTLFAFGATMLEDPECERLCGVMHKMRFQMAKPRTDLITAEQATAVRDKAREMGWFSVALAQAIQFDLMLRQKDTIGEMVPRNEPGVSDVFDGRRKWLRGIRWEEIDANLILRHVTSKRQKEIEVDLKLAPMVMEELRHVARFKAMTALGAKAILAGADAPLPAVVTRDMLPAAGPVVVSEKTTLPWTDHYFRRRWRGIARAAGVPDHVFNMDSRAGAISEATNAGADLEHVRHAATHSDVKMTQRYSRAGTEKVANVMQLRMKHRNKAATE